MQPQSDDKDEFDATVKSNSQIVVPQQRHKWATSSRWASTPATQQGWLSTTTTAAKRGQQQGIWRWSKYICRQRPTAPTETTGQDTRE